MAIGTYTVDNGVTGTGYLGSDLTVLQKIIPNNTIKIRSLLIKFYNTGTFNGKLVVWNTTGTKLYDSSVVTFTVTNTASLYEIGLSGDAGYIMSAGTTYGLGVYEGASSSANIAVVSGTGFDYTTETSSPAFATFTNPSPGTVWFSGGDTNALAEGTISWSLSGGFSFDSANVLPTAPTGISVTNSPVPSGTPPNVVWTHNDPNSDPQSQYQIRWRQV